MCSSNIFIIFRKSGNPLLEKEGNNSGVSKLSPFGRLTFVHRANIQFTPIKTRVTRTTWFLTAFFTAIRQFNRHMIINTILIDHRLIPLKKWSIKFDFPIAVARKYLLHIDNKLLGRSEE